MVEGSSPSAPTNFLGVNSRSTFSLNALSALVLNLLRTGRSQSASAVGLALRFTLKRSALRAPQDRQQQKGDISNEVRKGTFLKSFDKWSTSPHEPVDADSVSIRRIDANTVETLQKKDGKVVMTITSTTSKDGKTRTSTWRGKNTEDKDVHNVVVFDRQ
jgi:hypothetical protein